MFEVAHVQACQLTRRPVNAYTFSRWQGCDMLHVPAACASISNTICATLGGNPLRCAAGDGYI